MIILYILFVAYILAVNFYAFLLVKSLKTQEMESALSNPANTTQPKTDKSTSKLFITGLLGGAITIYVCMFIFKYKRSDLLLMVLMPLIGVINVYAWVMLFRSGFFIIVR